MSAVSRPFFNGLLTSAHSHAGVHAALFAEEAFHLIGPAGAAAVAEPEIALESVASLPLLLTALEGGNRGLIDAAFARKGLSAKVRLEVDSNEALLYLVRAGDGFAIMPFSAVHREVAEGDFSVSLIAPSIRRRLYHATPANRPVSPVSREVSRQLSSLAAECRHLARWSLPASGAD